MNPLDKEELSEILEIIKNDMPIHTDTTAKIKNSFSQGFPKNLMDYSSKVDNKFLNSNLAIIEEINYKNSNHWIPKAFQEYQNKIYGNTDILNHDNFFKAKLHDSFFKYQDDYGMPKNTHYMKGMSIQNVGFLGIIKTLVVGGAEIIIGDSSSHSTGLNGFIYLNQLSTTATIGANYDQLAHNVFNSTGNMRLAAYDSSSSIPTNLYAETSSVALDSAFTYRSVTNFSLITAQPWFGLQASVSGGDFYRKLQSTPRKGKVFTYGAFETPLTGTGNDLGATENCKIGHS